MIVDFAAPVLVIPEDSSSSTNTSGFVCDLGTIKIRSKVQRKDTKSNYKEITEFAKLYDCYELRLERIQIYIQDTKNNPNMCHKYIRNLSLQSKLYNCLESLNSEVPVMKVGGLVTQVDIVLTDYNILYMLRMLKNLQKEQQKLTKTIEDIHKKAQEKLTYNQPATGMTESEMLEDDSITEESPKSPEKEVEVKKEEIKKEEIPSMNPDKKMREITIHFDDINIIIGRAIEPNDQNYKLYADYIKSEGFEYENEIPFLPDLRIGVNGINAFVYMTCGGFVKAEVHIFRLYARDLQARLVGASVRKVVAKEFEYILSNPKVNEMIERRKGDNYSAFKSSEDLFIKVQESILFKEETNQMDLEFSIDLASQNMKLDLTLCELGITLPHQALVAPLSLLAKIADASASSIKLPQPAIAEAKEEKLEEAKEQSPPDPGKPFSLSVNTKIKGVYFIAPINVFLSFNNSVK